MGGTYFLKTSKMSRANCFPRASVVSGIGALMVDSEEMGVALSERLRLVPELSRASFVVVGGDIAIVPFAAAMALQVCGWKFPAKRRS